MAELASGGGDTAVVELTKRGRIDSGWGRKRQARRDGFRSVQLDPFFQPALPGSQAERGNWGEGCVVG